MSLLDAHGNAAQPGPQIKGSITDQQGVVMEAPYVMIAVPVQDMCYSVFANDLAILTGFTAMHVPDMGLRVQFLNASIGPVLQRAELMTMALEKGATHILWLDSDMRFPKYTLLHLLSTMHEKGLDVLAANYPTRKKPFQPVAFRHIGNDERVYTTPESPDLEKISAIGMGCMLVKLAKFREIPPPWFQVGYYEAANDYDGEDMFFARVCKKAGIDIWLDHRLSREIKHVGSYEFSSDHAVQYRDLTAPNPSQETPAT